MVQLTPEAQAIIDKNRAKKAKKEPATKVATKETKPIPLKSDYLGSAQELGDTLAVMGSGLTAGAGPWAIEKWSGYPARQKIAEAKERLGPVNAIPSEVFGAVAPTIFGVGLPALAARTPGLLGGAARTGLAAIEGAGYGATSAATDLDETTSPLRSGALGAGLGAGGALLGEGVGAGARLLSGTSAADEVGRIAAGRPQAAQNLAGLGREGMVADVLGEPGRTLTRKTADMSPEARQILEDALQERLAGQQQNIISSLEEAAQIAPQHRSTPYQLKVEAREHYRPGINKAYQSATQEGKQLEREQRVQSRFVQDEPGTDVLEEGARNVTPPRGRVVDELVDTETPRFFGDLLETPGGREAWGHAKKKLANMKPTHGEDVGGDFWMLNEAQKYLGHKARAAYKTGTLTGDFSEAEIYGPLEKAFRERMDGLLDLPQYTEARALHKTMKEDLSAIERGQKLAKKEYPSTLTREAIAAREGERGGLLGAAQAQGYAHQKINKLLGGDLNAAIRSFKSPLGQEGAQAALGDRTAIVEEAVRRADIFRDTARVPSGGSQTSRNSIPIIASELAKQLSAPALVGGLTLAHGLATGDASAYKTASAVVLTMAAKYGLNKLQTQQLSKHLPEIARILVGQEIPVAAPFRSGPASQIGSAVARGGGLLGAQ